MEKLFVYSLKSLLVYLDVFFIQKILLISQNFTDLQAVQIKRMQQLFMLD